MIPSYWQHLERLGLLPFLVLFIIAKPSGVDAQFGSSEKGIIFFDPSNLGDEFTRAEVFDSIKTFRVSTTVKFSSGDEDQILNNTIRKVVVFPSGVSRSQDYLSIAEELKALQVSYPQSRNLLSFHESRMRMEAAKLGKIEALRDRQARQVGRVISFKDNGGKAYENVGLKRIEPDGITVEIEGLEKKLHFSILPEEIQEFLGYDPIVAADYTRRVQERETQVERLRAAQAAEAAAENRAQEERDRMAAAQAEMERKQREEQLRVRPILEIESDMSSFLGKTLTVEGVISIDSYYNYEYDRFRDSHFCFEVRDENYDSAHVYASKSSDIGQSLRRELLDAGGSLKGTVSFTIDPRKLADYQTSILADLKGYGPARN